MSFPYKSKLFLNNIRRLYQIALYRLFKLSDISIYSNISKRYSKHPKVLTLDDTINELIRSNKSIARFGDGEYLICLGRGISFQNFDLSLSYKMREILREGSTDICLVAILNFPSKELNNYSKMFWFENIANICTILNRSKKYYNSNISRALNKTQFLLIKKIWQNRNFLFVSGLNSRFNHNHFLFDNIASKQMICSQPANAWEKYDELLSEVISEAKNIKDPLVICSLGPTATVLAYDLSTKYNIRTLDLGHLTNVYDMLEHGAPMPEKLPQ